MRDSADSKLLPLLSVDKDVNAPDRLKHTTTSIDKLADMGLRTLVVRAQIACCSRVARLFTMRARNRLRAARWIPRFMRTGPSGCARPQRVRCRERARFARATHSDARR